MQNLITTKDYAEAVSAATRWATLDAGGRAYILYNDVLEDYRVVSTAAFPEWRKSKIRTAVAVVDVVHGYIDANRVARAKSFQQITNQMDDKALLDILDTLPPIGQPGRSWGTTTPLGGIAERFWLWLQSVRGVFIVLAVVQCFLVLSVVGTITSDTLSVGVRFVITILLLLPMMVFGIIVDEKIKDEKNL